MVRAVAAEGFTDQGSMEWAGLHQQGDPFYRGGDRDEGNLPEPGFQSLLLTVNLLSLGFGWPVRSQISKPFRILCSVHITGELRFPVWEMWYLMSSGTGQGWGGGSRMFGAGQRPGLYS